MKPFDAATLKGFNPRSMIELLKMNKLLIEVFGQKSLRDYYFNSGNVFGHKIEDPSEAHSDNLKISYRIANKKDNAPKQDFASGIEEPSINQLLKKDA